MRCVICLPFSDTDGIQADPCQDVWVGEAVTGQHVSTSTHSDAKMQALQHAVGVTFHVAYFCETSDLNSKAVLSCVVEIRLPVICVCIS